MLSRGEKPVELSSKAFRFISILKLYWQSSAACIILVHLNIFMPLNHQRQPCFYIVNIFFICYKTWCYHSQRSWNVSINTTFKSISYSTKGTWKIHMLFLIRMLNVENMGTVKNVFFFFYVYNSWYHFGDSVSVAILEANCWNEAKCFNDTYHTIHVAQANYSLLIIISLTMSHPKHFFSRHGALQFVQKHFSILNDTSLWADNWRDSVNCDKLKVWSNYTDSHRRIKVSASLCGATPLMRQHPIIETRHPLREWALLSPDSQWWGWSFC